jgi:hypothetical protein
MTDGKIIKRLMLLFVLSVLALSFKYPAKEALSLIGRVAIPIFMSFSMIGIISVILKNKIEDDRTRPFLDLGGIIAISSAFGFLWGTCLGGPIENRAEFFLLSSACFLSVNVLFIFFRKWLKSFEHRWCAGTFGGTISLIFFAIHPNTWNIPLRFWHNFVSMCILCLVSLAVWNLSGEKLSDFDSYLPQAIRDEEEQPFSCK